METFETPASSTFVLVPGAWLGGWCWREVATNLRSLGHTVISATLTGLGERAHLLGPEVGLSTHVADIVGLLHYRDLKRVVLVGHSYGGTVITAVADKAASRIRCLVYLDASVPQDGQANNDVLGPERAAQIRQLADANGYGWRVPAPSTFASTLEDPMRSWVEQRLTPHPLRSLEEPVRLASQAATELPRAFLRSSIESPLYTRLLERGRAAGWHCADIAGGHYPMLTHPQAVAAALTTIP
jgi:pimeloyl-ACP methyl ester carboxylesterase